MDNAELLAGQPVDGECPEKAVQDAVWLANQLLEALEGDRQP